MHCDIGGGYPNNSLSDMALLWMAERAREYRLEFLPGTFSPDGPTEMTPEESTDFKVDPDPMTHPHSSWTKFYRLVKPLDRPIGKAADDKVHHLDGLEYVAATAKKHYGGNPSYRLSELVKYIEDSADISLEPRPETAWPIGAHSRGFGGGYCPPRPLGVSYRPS